MNILLTGSSGFTGTHFSALARANGFKIFELKSNLLDIEQLNAEVLLASPDVVVHLAAISFVGHSNVQDFHNVNAEGTLNLLKSLTRLSIKPKKILFASSANVYGNCPISPIDENQVLQPVNDYARSKLAAEQVVENYFQHLPIIVVRPFNYTGPGQSKSFIIPKLVDHFARKMASIQLGNLDVEREYNDVRFVVNAYLKLIMLGKPGEYYNICTGRTYKLLDVVAKLTELTKHRISIKINPDLKRMNEIRLLSGSNEKLIKTIGFIESYSLDQTLERMIDRL